MADRLCAGSLTPLLLNLMRSAPPEAGEVEELRALVEELTRKVPPREKPE
jgi:hypothetical protein